jgi:hypothetical protein
MFQKGDKVEVTMGSQNIAARFKGFFVTHEYVYPGAIGTTTSSIHRDRNRGCEMVDVLFQSERGGRCTQVVPVAALRKVTDDV